LSSYRTDYRWTLLPHPNDLDILIVRFPSLIPVSVSIRTDWTRSRHCRTSGSGAGVWTSIFSVSIHALSLDSIGRTQYLSIKDLVRRTVCTFVFLFSFLLGGMEDDRTMTSLMAERGRIGCYKNKTKQKKNGNVRLRMRDRFVVNPMLTKNNSRSANSNVETGSYSIRWDSSHLLEGDMIPLVWQELSHL